MWMVVDKRRGSFVDWKFIIRVYEVVGDWFILCIVLRGSRLGGIWIDKVSLYVVDFGILMWEGGFLECSSFIISDL